MLATLIISIVTFILVILSILFIPVVKIRNLKIETYWIIALIGASILLIFGFVPFKNIFNELISDTAINPLKILILFFSMTSISIFLDELGLFKYLSSLASNKVKGNQYTLFLVLFVLTSVLTVFTSNDVVILTLTPFICFFAKRSRINPIPYLVSEFVAANTWSLMFVIGNPTNIYLATSNNINFLDYFKVMALPTVVGGIVELAILLLIFRKHLKQPLISNEVTYQIEDKLALGVGVFDLLLCLAFLVVSSYIHLEMWLIALACAVFLFLFMLIYSLFNKNNFGNVTRTLKRMPYQLIPFFLSMFVIVVALNFQGISEKIVNILGNKNTIWVYGFSSYLSSNLINNIPMSILFANLIGNLEESVRINAVYASIIGSNIGAFLTPIGALAGIMFSSLVKENGVRFSFIDFIKYGSIISLPVMVVALGMLQLMVK